MRLPNAAIVVSVPRERAFAFMRDEAKVRHWQPEVIASRRSKGDGLEPGSRWRVTVEERGRGRFELDTWIVAVTDNERLVYAWDEPRSAGQLDYRLESSGPGTRIECIGDFHIKGLGKLFAPLVRGFVARKFASRLQLLGDAMEASERPKPGSD